MVRLGRGRSLSFDTDLICNAMQCNNYRKLIKTKNQRVGGLPFEETYLLRRSIRRREVSIFSRSLAILRVPCQLTPIYSTSSLNVRVMSSSSPSEAPPLSSAVFWLPVHCSVRGSFYLQSEDVDSHFPFPCCDNVLESHHACQPHHLFISRDETY